jgi:drug/metabolite transporter (DMT)-like permease
MNAAVILLSVVCSSLAHVALKIGMNAVRATPAAGPWEYALRTALNPFVILGMGLHFVALAIWLYALSKVDVSYAYPFIALGFVLVLAYSHFFLHEDVNLWRLAGVLLICGGVALVAKS